MDDEVPHILAIETFRQYNVCEASTMLIPSISSRYCVGLRNITGSVIHAVSMNVEKGGNSDTCNRNKTKNVPLIGKKECKKGAKIMKMHFC